MMISENQIEVGRHNIHYYEAGEPHQRTIMLLHGYLGDAWLHWEGVMPLLAESYHVIAPDLPGYGGSNALPNLNMPALLQWCIDLIDALGVGDAVVIGSSLGGGLVARLLAVEYPQYVPVLVLVNGGTLPAVPGCARMIAATPVIGALLYDRLAASQTARGGLGGLFTDDENMLTDERVRRIAAQKKATAQYMRQLSLLPLPKKRVPPVPVLLIWGEEDAITPLVFGQGLHEHIPGSQLQTIVGLRHLPHVEDPDIFAFQVKQFLERLERRRFEDA